MLTVAPNTIIAIPNLDQWHGMSTQSSFNASEIRRAHSLEERERERERERDDGGGREGEGEGDGERERGGGERETERQKEREKERERERERESQFVYSKEQCSELEHKVRVCTCLMPAAIVCGPID